ncbi:MAG: SUMF1/EgtB/PvdO family nonheme iron enzyme [Candidatus Delongbacteria bacterium]|nr:SUMF1/EgtB/PvdO family nonheme iron enzyme [Candidatus Delongbacteria bacterium]MBN2834484.1 SUMF1/EgtB/PvdO family nonheme iron enzyme [Candidatus Delongbacteria bacterium]
MICKVCNTLNEPKVKKCVTCGEKIKIRKIKFTVGDSKRMLSYKMKIMPAYKIILRYLMPAIVVLFLVFLIVTNIDNILRSLIPPPKEKQIVEETKIIENEKPDKEKAIIEESKKVEEKVIKKETLTKIIPKTELKEPEKKEIHNVYEGMVESDSSIFYASDSKRMVLVPSQIIEIGNDNDQLAKPSHEVKVDAFYMDAFEVTNGEYRKFLIETNYKLLSDYPHFTDSRFNEDRQPMINVSHQDAESYARWAGKRLPSEEEWECAAKGGMNYKYTTGNELNQSMANYFNSINDGKTSVVGSYKPNPYGIYDLGGNVCELISDVLTPYIGNNSFSPSWGKWTYRGGSWLSQGDELRTFDRRSTEYESGSVGNKGFRCVISKSAVLKK